MNRITELLQELQACKEPRLAQKILAKVIHAATEQMVEYESSDSSTAKAGPLGLGNLKYSAPSKKKDDGAAMTGLAAMLMVLASDASSNSFLRDQFKNQASSIVQKIQENYGIHMGMMSAKLQTVLKSSSHLSEMQEEFEKASKKASEATERMPVLSQSLEEATRQLAEYQSKNDQLIADGAEVRNQLQALQQQVNSLEADRQEIIDLQAKVVLYKSQIAENDVKAKELEVEILELQNREKQLADTIKARAVVTQQLVETTSRMDDALAKKIQQIWELLPKDQLDMMLN